MNYIEREIEPQITKWLENRQILIIRGSRQSGKTTLLNRLKENLLSKQVPLENIHYFIFEDPILRMKFEENPKEFVKNLLTNKEKHYLLLDEVQYVKDVGQKLKLIFDSFEQLKIIVTGSSSFDLTTLGKYLVGRAIFFDLYPFSFAEFLKSKGKNYENLYNEIKINILEPKFKKTIFIEDLNKLLHEYVTYGSYPEIVLENDIEKKKELIKNLFSTFIEKDVVSRFGIKYREKTVRLLKTLASSLGNIIKYETLCTQSELTYDELKEILSILEDTYVIHLVRPFYKNILNELRKNPKIYFIDFGLRNYLLENFDKLNYDHLYENFVLNELQPKYKINYWRTTSKTEVDFVIEKEGKIIPIEVKTTPKITRSFRSFINHYKPENAFIANLKSVEENKVDDCKVYFAPLSYF